MMADIPWLCEVAMGFPSLAIPHHVRRGRWFFPGLVLLMFAAVIAVHGVRFFFVWIYRPPDFSGAIIHIHVAIVAGWMLVLLVQVALARVRNVALHRRLGMASLALAVLMLIFGILATADMLYREPKSLHGSIVPFMQITDFALFAGLAYWWRKDREAHKRLIALAMVDPIFGVVVPLTHRYMQPIEHWANLSWTILLLLIAYDLWTRQKLHPVTLWGSLWLILVQDLRPLVGNTAQWEAVAQWMRSWGI